jgi:SpoVK/Ycf46/Vps4 family AAA+-type ATPase
MNSATTVIASGLIAQYLPVDNDMVRMQLGVAIHEMLSRGFNQTTLLHRITRWFRSPDNKVSIKESLNGEKNPIYTFFEEFLVKNHADQLEGCELIPKNGDIELTVTKQCNLTGISYNYQNHIIDISITENTQETTNTSKSQDKSGTSGNKQIILTSRSADNQLMRDFVKDKCKSPVIKSQILKIYRSYATPGKECRSTWEQLYVKTNKSIHNTIVSDTVKQQLFDDVNHFINNERWYAQKGIPYKRGYILHGPPGTGKTSIIKAIANEYNLPIFSIDLSSLGSNNDLIQLVTEINYYVQDGRYILTFEDVDRTSIFKNAGSRYYCSRRDEITADCLLNVIDGVMETHGRIVFVTANDVKPLTEMEAFIRPGRIDRKILISYCDQSQFQQLVGNFYHSDTLLKSDINSILAEHNITCPSDIAPANLIELLQQYPSLDLFVKHFITSPTGINRDTSELGVGEGKYTGRRGTMGNADKLTRQVKQHSRELKRRQSQLRRITTRTTNLTTKVIPKLEDKLTTTKNKITKHKQTLRKIQQTRKKGGPYCCALTSKGLPCLQPVSVEGGRCRFHK